MRDYFLYPAQTNLEFYAQVIDHPYSQAQRRRIAGAYQFALKQVFPLARGSGKPFIAHLVGTASLVLESGCPEDWVIAALLHAIYQRRVPFAGGLSPEQRRSVVSGQFGQDVDDLVHRYTDFEAEDLGRVTLDYPEANADVVTLRLADELEDLCGNALALHGNPDADEVVIRGSYAWRREAKMREAPSLLEKASILGLSGIERGLMRWTDFSAVPEEMSEMGTGWLTSMELSSNERPGT